VIERCARWRYDEGVKAFVAAQGQEPKFAPDPVIDAYKRGVDRSLLLENLAKTPEQRVRALIALQALAREAREAGRRARGY
jgi:hypothetical protein